VGRKEQSSVREVYAHGSYLVNLATPDHEILELSLRTTAEELRRCALLGIKLLVIHPGAHKGSGEERGMVRMAGALRELAAAHPGVSLCVETGAGQGTGLCSRFEQLAELVHAAGPETRVCLDTCHVFAAGYDISTPAGFAATLRELERRVGMERLALLHLNDSKGGSGSRLDRHQHIGQGVLGLDVFRCIMQSRELAGLPKIIETPKEDGDRMDQENLELLRSLAGGEPCA
jgi:deoxyribonuclease-4